ncbi:MAG: ABC transporter permease [Undibacterium sp.]|nr:ABC transporter permease [Opitutaceae bacterium]
MNKLSPTYDVIIRPRQSWLHFDWRALVQYRDLLREMVSRDFTSRYKQTILGPAWFIINPLITTTIFILVFGKVVGVPTDGIHPALFYLCGLLAWSYFSQVLASTGNTLHGNINLFAKVYFPRLIVPLSVVVSNLLTFAIQFASFVVVYVFLLYTGSGVVSRPSVWALALPLVVLHTALLALGVGLILSSISAKYKDFTHLASYLVQIWMYASPIIYPLSKIPEKWQWLAVINPMTAIIEGFRSMLLGTHSVSAAQYGCSAAISAVLCVVGVLLFQRVARSFVDFA